MKKTFKRIVNYFFKNNSQSTILYKDDNKFDDIYNLISNNNIEFNIKDDCIFTGLIQKKLWICGIYLNYKKLGIYSDIYVSVRVPLPDIDIYGKSVSSHTIELFFSNDNVEKLKIIINKKINEFRVNSNAIYSENKREELISKSLYQDKKSLKELFDDAINKEDYLEAAKLHKKISNVE